MAIKVMEELDVVVIGAGIYGLAVAKTYLEVNPAAKLLILESANSIGGTWAEHRLYPGLKTNNMLGTYEFSDFPMDSETYHVKPGQHIPGPTMHRYLADYAAHFNLVKHIRFGAKVESAEHKEGGGWRLKLAAAAKGEKAPGGDELFAQKLVLATGLTSDPFLPKITGSEIFGAPLFHSKEFLSHEDTLKTATSVTVFGGTKSAWDAVYAYASKGVKVDWVIRESGHGPTWMAPPYVTPLKKWLEKLLHMRLLTWFSPCIWGDADGYPGVRKFFHASAMGRFIVDKFWAILGGDVMALNAYDAHPETQKLKPWISPFWIAASLSILNYDTNIFDYVRDGSVKVHIADIVSLGPQTVNLSNGSAIPTDALLCATGWKPRPPVQFLPEGIDASLGLPHRRPPTPSAASNINDISSLITRADAEILTRFPRLKAQPKWNSNFIPLKQTQDLSSPPREKNERSEMSENEAQAMEPWRLYRFMVPPAFLTTRDIAFAGALLTISTTLVAQTQALWITSFFSSPSSSAPTQSSLLSSASASSSSTPAPGGVIDPLAKSSLDEIKYETVLHSRFGKWRCSGGFGAMFPDFAFDSVPYLDLLLKDLSLRRWRKGGMMKEVLEPYGPKDYIDLVGEWMCVQEGRARRSEVEGHGTQVYVNGAGKAHMQ